MMLILNRLRGTQGLWSKIIGLLLALVVQIVFDNTYVSLAVGLGYIIGESFGWGEWIGTICNDRKTVYLQTEEGKSNGIRFITQKIYPSWKVDFLNYSRIALTIRGFYWWIPTLAPLYFVGFNPYILLCCIAFLSAGFPIACELGRYFKDKIYFEKYGLVYKTAWTLQEGFYGLMQDVVLITLICTSL